jgi:pimeloyl-ACP methyl ester carboxylesterase
VTSLALLRTFARGRHATALTPGMMWLGLRARVGTRRMRRNAFLELVLTPERLAEVDREALASRLAELFGHDLADQPPVVMKQLRACARFDVLDRLRTLPRIPALVLSAQHDRISRLDTSKELAAAIPGATFQLFPAAGHGVPIDRASEINTLLARHLGAGG